MEFPPLGYFRWTRKILIQAPTGSKCLQKPVFAMRNASQKKPRKAVQLVRATPREEGSTEPNTKLAKRFTVTGDKILHDIIPMTEDIIIASTM
eukprot:12099142-Ditylum_brightwellii.AAC.1